MKGLIWKFIVGLALLLFISSCDYNSFEDIVPPEPRAWAVNTTIGALSPTTTPVQNNAIVSGVVISSDSAGNFYKELLIFDVNSTSQPTLRVLIDLYDTYGLYPVGEVVAVRLDGMSLEISDTGLLTAGYISSDQTTLEAITTLPLVAATINLQGTSEPLAPVEVTIDELENISVGNFVRLSNIYFLEQSGVFRGERELRQVGAESGIELITSDYALFANDPVPYGLLSIDAIVLKNGSNIALKISSPESIEHIITD